MIIYGLGNNEDKYLGTKHNIGRVFVEGLASKFDIKFKKLSLKNGENIHYAKKDNLVLAFSDGYMNTSGQPLVNLINYFKLDIKNLIVIQDDSDLNVLNHKFICGGGSAGHKGISSIQKQIHMKDFWRLKIGIRPINNKSKSETFVLRAFEEGEKDYCVSLLNKFYKNIDLFLSHNSKFQTLINSA